MLHFLVFGHIMIAAAEERRGAVLIAVREPIGIGEKRDGVSQVDLGVESARLAAIPHPKRRRLFDLHQAEAMVVDEAGIIAAFAPHDAMDEGFRDAMNPGRAGDHLAVDSWPRRGARKTGRTRQQRGGGGQRNAKRW
jgi:hypothetical protein